MLARSAFRPRKRNAGRPPEKSCPAFLQWLRGRSCLAGGTCAGRIEAAHIDYAPGKGVGTKPADRYAVPLCAAHHGEQHQAGIRTFEKRHGINMLSASEAYWQAWPGRHAWENRDG